LYINIVCVERGCWK